MGLCGWDGSNGWSIGQWGAVEVSSAGSSDESKESNDLIFSEIVDENQNFRRGKY